MKRTIDDVTKLLDDLAYCLKKVMTGEEFARKAKDIAKNYKSLYVHGCFGAPMTAKNKKRWISEFPYNAKPARKALIEAASPDTFGFDCVNLLKAILWGWSGDANSEYGGCKYESNGVPDIDTSEMLKHCSNITDDFENIEVGEYLWMKGHCGVYIGDGLAVECTPKWDDKVQITACNRDKSGYHRRDWTKHGRLEWIEYTRECEVELPILRKGSAGDAVKNMQTLLLTNGEELPKYGADGDFGEETERAVKSYQKRAGIEVDGIVGSETWEILIEP